MKRNADLKEYVEFIESLNAKQFLYFLDYKRALKVRE